MGQVHLTVDAGVATLTLDNPEVRNALSEDMATQLLGLCDQIDADRSIAVTVVRGSGAMFCSGADKRRLLDPSLAIETGSPATKSLEDSILRLGHLETPVIAAVRGAAVGAGLNLALASDVMVVGENAKLIPAFQKLGIHPGVGFFALVNRRSGRQAAAALGLFGEQLDGVGAAQCGLAWAAVPDDEVLGTADELARRVAGDADLVRVATRSFRLSVGPPALSWPAALEIERGAQTWSRERLPQP